MKIGLVRHFKVEQLPERGWITGEQFNRWVAAYDEAGTIPAEFTDRGDRWDRCICSDLPRAVHTARHIYPGDIEAGAGAAPQRLSRTTDEASGKWTALCI